MFAVIKTGGKQYCVRPNSSLRVEKIDVAEGETFDFAEVMLLKTEDTTLIGKPFVSGATVKAQVVEHFKAPKVMIFKKKRRKNYRRKKGHRQEQTRVKVLEILA